MKYWIRLNMKYLIMYSNMNIDINNDIDNDSNNDNDNNNYNNNKFWGRLRARECPTLLPSQSEGGMIRYGWIPSSSSSFSIRYFRVCPLVEIRQAAPCRAIRGDSVSVNSTPLLDILLLLMIIIILLLIITATRIL